MFDTYMIVYEKNIERVKNFNNMKNKISFIEKFNAIDSIYNNKEVLLLNEKLNLNTINIINSNFKGKLGCNMSHQLLWINHLKSVNDWLLILEDDTNIEINNELEFKNIINKIIKEAENINSNFIQCEIRNHHLEEQKKYNRISENLYKLKPQCGMSAYLVNKNTCKYLIKYNPLNVYVDVLTNNNEIIYNLNSSCFINNIFKTLGAQRYIDKKSLLGSIIYNS